MKVAAAFAGGRYEGKWPLAQVQYLADVRAGDGISAERIVEDGPVRVFGGNGLRGFTDRHNVDGERVLVGRQGALCGNVHTVDGKLWASEHALVVTPTHGHHHRWLGYVLQAADLGRLSVAAAQPGITRTAVATDLVPMAPQADQQRIASYLDRETAEIDAMDAELDRLVETLRERAEVVVESAMNNSGRLTKLGLVVDTLAGFAFPSKGFARDPEQYRLLRGVNLKPGRTDWSDVVYWPAGEASGLARYELAAGDIVLGMDRPFIGSGTRVARISESDLPAMLLQRVLRLRPSPGTSADFIHLALMSVRFRDYATPDTTGISVPHISEGQVVDFAIPLPSLSEQQTIASHALDDLRGVADMIADAQRLKSLLAERRSTLITDVVTGKKEVPA